MPSCLDGEERRTEAGERSLVTNDIRSYEHHNINEPAILLGGSFMVDVVEHAEHDGKKTVHNQPIDSGDR